MMERKFRPSVQELGQAVNAGEVPREVSAMSRYHRYAIAIALAVVVEVNYRTLQNSVPIDRPVASPAEIAAAAERESQLASQAEAVKRNRELSAVIQAQQEREDAELAKRFPHGAAMIGGQFFELVPSKNRGKPGAPWFELRSPQPPDESESGDAP
jgi:hypothetical protein